MWWSQCWVFMHFCNYISNCYNINCMVVYNYNSTNNTTQQQPQINNRAVLAAGMYKRNNRGAAGTAGTAGASGFANSPHHKKHPPPPGLWLPGMKEGIHY